MSELTDWAAYAIRSADLDERSEREWLDLIVRAKEFQLKAQDAIKPDDDAKKVAATCNIVLTAREMGTGNRVPLAGVPYHALETYLARLINAGHKVAIVEQMGDEPVKGLMTREVVRVVSHHSIQDTFTIQHNFHKGTLRNRSSLKDRSINEPWNRSSKARIKIDSLHRGMRLSGLGGARLRPYQSAAISKYQLSCN